MLESCKMIRFKLEQYGSCYDINLKRSSVTPNGGDIIHSNKRRSNKRSSDQDAKTNQTT